MNSLSHNISYELQILRNSRWQIKSLFGPNGRAAAVSLAKRLSRDPTIDGVRVVKEVFDSYSAEDTAEYVVYSSRKVRRRRVKPLAERELRLDYGPGEDWMGIGRHRKLARIAARKVFRRQRAGVSAAWDELPLASKTIAGLTASFVAAVVLTVFAVLIVPATSIGHGDRTMAFLVMFLLIFLVCGGPVVVWSVATAFGTGTGARKGHGTDDDAKKPPLVKPRVATHAPPPPPPPAPGTVRLPPTLENAEVFLTAFAKQCRRKANAAFDLSSDFSAFGVNLFIAGACEPVCDHHAIVAEDRPKVLAAVLTKLGLETKRVDSFVAQVSDYLLVDVRYMEMFTAGRDAMAGHIDGDSHSFDSLSLALAEWSGKTEKKPDDSLVTLVFTAIADLDSLTAAHGDDASSRISRAHQRIADRIIDEHGGKRVKHTSDGVMIAFSSAINAVRASAAIQESVARHRADAPTIAFDLKIGINAGSPVVEDDDYFGNVVQCAARLCYGASPNEIMVSAIVRDLCGGFPALPQFIAKGEWELKGFKDPVAVFEIDWTRPAPGDSSSGIAPESTAAISPTPTT